MNYQMIGLTKRITFKARSTIDKYFPCGILPHPFYMSPINNLISRCLFILRAYFEGRYYYRFRCT